MLTNLFSMFDSHIHKFDPLLIAIFWAFLILSMKSNVFYLVNKFSLATYFVITKIKNEFATEIETFEKKEKNIKNKGAMKLCLSIFSAIFFLNYFSLYPFIMSTTSHMSFNLPITILIWSLGLTMAYKIDYKSFLAHLTPLGTPTALMSFMVLIESVSNVIRPLTLAVRLMANMVAGHLLLVLLSNFSMNSSLTLLVSIPIMIVLALLETGVSFIQAYVITLLSILYLKEAF